MPYRVAADLLQHLLPIDTGKSPETLRSHTLRVGRRLSDAAGIVTLTYVGLRDVG